MMINSKSIGNALPKITHIAALFPLGLIIWDFLTDNLTVNPIQELTLRTGKTALILLLFSLACTPVSIVFKYRPALRLRKPLGLYAFFYVCMHLGIFSILDYGLRWNLIYEAIFEKPYALVGFTAFLILTPMAITSTKGWMKRLGKWWKRLHRAVYLAALLAVVHYIWLVKSDIREPIIYAAILISLLLLRVPPVKYFFKNRNPFQIGQKFKTIN